MSKDGFFQEIEHTAVPWRQRQLYVPVFYQDVMSLSVSFLAPMERVKAILPSTRMKPYRVSPWHSIVSITAYKYRDSDIGPYNEISIAVPITLDRETPLFTGTIRRTPQVPKLYVRHLPVTTEIAREVGVEFAGYPKFLAEIDFVEEGDWVSCALKAENKHVLTLKGRKLELQQFSRFRAHPITYRRGFLLRSEIVVNERDMGISKNAGDTEIHLGEHPIAEELKDMKLGRVLAYQYCPQYQIILTPVFESYAA